MNGWGLFEKYFTAPHCISLVFKVIRIRLGQQSITVYCRRKMEASFKEIEMFKLRASPAVTYRAVL